MSAADDQRAAEPRPVEVVRRLLAQGQQPFSGDSHLLLAEYDRLRSELAETRAVLTALADELEIADLATSPDMARGMQHAAKLVRRSVRGDAPTEPPAAAPTSSDLRRILAEITETATTDSGILQPGAAYALGALAELVKARPGCMPEHVADAITATAPPAVGLPVTLSSPDDVAAVCLAHGLTSFDASPWEEGGAWETAGILVEARDDQTWHITLDGEHGADLDYGYPAAALVAAIEAARDGAQ